MAPITGAFGIKPVKGGYFLPRVKKKKIWANSGFTEEGEIFLAPAHPLIDSFFFPKGFHGI